MAILETMGRGIVNISTSIAAIPEVITQGETGFLVEPGDREALGRILLRVSREPDLRRRISDNAFQRIRRDHSLESGVRLLEQIYFRLNGQAICETGGSHGGIL
jgi:glycosyltransferase involved in cell wall biosynthesis